MNNKQISRDTILAIIDTYEGMLRLEWSNEIAALWTNWKALLLAL